MTDKQKIIKYLDFKGISKNKFYLKTGLSVGFLDSGSSLGVDKLRLIIDNYHDLNADWILTGKGSMLKKDLNDNEMQFKSGLKSSDDVANDYNKINDFQIEKLKQEIEQKNIFLISLQNEIKRLYKEYEPENYNLIKKGFIHIH